MITQGSLDGHPAAVSTIPPRLPSAAEMDRAFRGRDATYDGIFYVGVRTTSIFCRPSCPARKPKPQNVAFFATPREAIFAGYRPCKRCGPLDSGGRPPAWMTELVDEVERDPTVRLRDGDLRARGLDPARVRRAFLRHYGLTFHAFARGLRLGGAFQRIRGGAELDDVILDHGFESYSGFREAFGRTFGAPPGRSRDSDCVQVAWIESPLGPLVAGATSAGLCLLEFSDRRMLEAQLVTLRKRFAAGVVPGENDHLAALRAQLAEYFAGRRTAFQLTVLTPGTPFQERVWQALREIPFGQTRSYQDIAVALGEAGAVRAVGRANGMNRVAIVVPCHRVVQKDGRLGGYGGGLWRKQRLLELEGVCLPTPLPGLEPSADPA
jgi:AraC family transcriptional regulator of adaptative response/methylated-DNA-[protein]-cysteine methyltransferase